jgi:phytoene desaturase
MASIGIVGAGLGGLSAAIHLASRGYEVTVYERNSTAGGKASEIRSAGFRFDTGPSLITMPFVLDELYDAGGATADERVELLPVDPICRYFFPDGSVLDAASDERKFRIQVAAFSPQDADAVSRFLDYSQRIYELTSDIFLFQPLTELKSLLRWKHAKTLLHLPQIDAFRTVHEGVQSFFHDERLVQLFDRYATYNGSNPYTAPATLNIIPYVEYRLGGYYVRGGVYALVRSLVKVAERLGVRFHFDTTVEEIVTEHSVVRGVRCRTGTRFHDAVISNADAVHTMARLLAVNRDKQPSKHRYEKLEPSCSGLVFLWGVRGRRDTLAQHNIFFSRDYREEFDDIFVRRIPPSDPTVYLSITAREDRDHAPEGYENYFVLVNMPYLTEHNRNYDWTGFRECVLRRLLLAGIDIARDIVYEELITPVDLEKRFNANRGSIYGISSNSRNAAFLRPPNRVGKPRGLYLCGGASHPGGGVPLVLLSGKLAAEAVMR